MTVTFNTIPSNLRVPGFYFEFDPSRANTGTQQKKLVVLGQRLNSGSVASHTPVVISRASQAEEYFGRGSMLADMLDMVFQNNPQVQVWAIASDDLPAGLAATGSINVAGVASTAGLLRINVGGKTANAGIASSDAPATVAANIVAAINAQTDLPISAQLNTGDTSTIDIAAKNKGVVGNDIDIDLEIEAAQLPTAPTFNITQLTGGAGNPDVADALAAMGDEWYNWIVMPWVDAANLAVLDDELNDRYSSMRQIGCRAFTAVRGSHAELLGFGNTRNNYHVTTMGCGQAPQPAYLWSAANATAAANSLQIDPTRQLHSLELVGIEAPFKSLIFTKAEQNQQLFDGISTYTVDNDGTVRIQSQITNYQENAQGLADDSVLYVNTPEFYDAYRWEQRILFAPYARDKLADDGNKIPAGQPIMTPKKARGLLLAFYKSMVEERGWCEDYEHYKNTLIVEKQENRLAIVDQPNQIDNLRQIYGRSEMVK